MCSTKKKSISANSPKWPAPWWPAIGAGECEAASPFFARVRCHPAADDQSRTDVGILRGEFLHSGARRISIIRAQFQRQSSHARRIFACLEIASGGRKDILSCVAWRVRVGVRLLHSRRKREIHGATPIQARRADTPFTLGGEGPQWSPRGWLKEGARGRVWHPK